jgi:PLP dependent protein
MVPVVQNRDAIVARIAGARKRAIAPAAETRLIAVSKFHPAEPIRALLAAGQRDFGENRVQEAAAKWPPLKREYPDIALHMIGPLQSNKVREAVELFDAIHSLDRPKLIGALKVEIERSGRRPDLFVQINTGEEPQKSGVLPKDAPAFIVLARQSLGDAVKGLMCIPPADDAPAPHFALLRKLASEAGLALLSMGMSDDFETAIAFGATHIRVGTAIFGERPKLQ